MYEKIINYVIRHYYAKGLGEFSAAVHVRPCVPDWKIACTELRYLSELTYKHLTNNLK